MRQATILFIQGGSHGAHQADQALANSLKTAFTDIIPVVYPTIPNEDEPDYETFAAKIDEMLTGIEGDVVLAGHSLGALFVLKLIGLNPGRHPILGIFLASTPFWGDGGWQYEGFTIDNGRVAVALAGVPIFFYQGTKDETVEPGHLDLYRKIFPAATFRFIEGADHQLNNDLDAMSEDIATLLNG